MSRVITVDECCVCPYRNALDLSGKFWCMAAIKVIDKRRTQLFPAWCPLPEKEKEESDAKG